MTEWVTSGSVGRALGNRCLYPDILKVDVNLKLGNRIFYTVANVAPLLGAWNYLKNKTLPRRGGQLFST
jgi:hypothetical protein